MMTQIKCFICLTIITGALNLQDHKMMDYKIKYPENAERGK